MTVNFLYFLHALSTLDQENLIMDSSVLNLSLKLLEIDRKLFSFEILHKHYLLLWIKEEGIDVIFQFFHEILFEVEVIAE